MNKNYYGKLMKAKWQSDDFGRGKSPMRKRDIRRKIKSVTQKRFKRNMKIDYED